MADREHGRKWDGVSRVPDDTYRQNWNNIFGEKEKTESEKLKNNTMTLILLILIGVLLLKK